MAAALARRRRATITIEAVLAIPALLVLFGAVSQTLLLAQSRAYLEQAAYAAARSALVYKCPPFNIVEALKSPIAALRGGSCSDEPQRWEDAARWALVAAAPSSAFASSRGVCPDVRAGSELVDGAPLDPTLQEATANRICYAYEPENVSVEVEWVQSGPLPIQTGATPSVEATVRYRYPLTTPFRRFVADGQRGDGTYWRWVEATVVLR